jgi:hypothetical protein
VKHKNRGKKLNMDQSNNLQQIQAMIALALCQQMQQQTHASLGNVSCGKHDKKSQNYLQTHLIFRQEIS